MQTTPKPKTIDEYIALFPAEVKELLEKIRTAIIQTVPKAEEYIGYEMPAYRLNGILVYFAAFKKHISLFPGPTAIDAFKEELSVYKTSKGTIQFPIEKGIPVTLIKKIVKFRVNENLKKTDKKKH